MMQDKMKFLLNILFILCVLISLSAVAAQDSSDMNATVQDDSFDDPQLAVCDDSDYPDEYLEIDENPSATVEYYDTDLQKYDNSKDTVKTYSSVNGNSNDDILGDGIEIYVPTSNPDDSVNIIVYLDKPNEYEIEVYLGDPPHTYTVSGNTFQDIQNEIDKTVAYDQVIIPAGTYIGNGTPIVISHQIKVIGQGNPTLDAQGMSSILIVSDGYGRVEVSGINFVNANAPGDGGIGGAIVWGGPYGKISNCNFENNHAGYLGGAIACKHHDCIVENCNFFNNTASIGGAVLSASSHFTISKCNFIDNSAPDRGGAVYMEGESSTITDSYFENNHATYGAAVLWNAAYGRVSSSTFENNSASSHGGAMAMVRNGGTIDGCHYINNDAGYSGAVYIDGDGYTMSNCEFKYNHAINFAGAIEWFGDNSKLLNCAFIENIADLYSGGAIYMDGDNAILINSTFKDNQGKQAGGIRIIGNNNEIADMQFINNHASLYGGGICLDSTNSTVRNSSFVNNTAGERSGAIYIHDNNNRILDSNFVNNQALLYGGAIMAYNVDGEVDNCYFENNSVTATNSYGGAILWIHDKNPLNYLKVSITNSNFTNNHAPLGAVTFANTNESDDYLISNCRFKDDYISKILLISSDDLTLKFRIEAYYDYYTSSVTGTFKKSIRDIYCYIGDEYQGPKSYDYLYSQYVIITSKPYLILEIFNDSNNELVYNQTIKSDNTGSITFSYRDLPDGEYRYRVYNSGDDGVPPASYEGAFSRHHAQTNVSISVSNAEYPESPIATVTGSSPGTYNILIGGKSYSVSFTESEIENGGGQTTKTIDLGTLDANSNYVATVNYEITDYYASASTQTSFSVNQGTPNIGISGTVIYYGQDAVLDYTITEGVDFDSIIIKKGDKTLVNGTDYVLIKDNNKFIIRGLAEGTYIVNMTTDENTNYISNSQETTITVNPLVDLGIGLSVNNQTPLYGDTVSYTITLSNNGPSTATNIIVSSTLANGMNVSSPDASYIGNGKWNITSIASGSENAITLTLYATANSIESLTYTVSATSKEDDSNTENNNKDITIQAIPLSDITVSGSMAFDGETLKVGDRLTYTFNVTNRGPCDVKNIRVTDEFDSGLLSLISATLNGASIGYNNGYNINSLSNGSSSIIVLTFKVINNGTIENTLSVESAILDIDESNNIAQCDSVNAMPSVDISIVQSPDNNAPFYGNTVTYTIILKNNGPSIATDIIVTDTIPNGINASSPDAEYIGNGIWKISRLGVGSENAITLTLYATVNSLETLTNTVTVTSHENDSNIENNKANADVKANPINDLKISSVSDATTPKNIGDVIAYTITVVNEGPCNASNVKVTEILSPLVKLISAKTDIGNYDNTSNIWNIGNLNTNDSHTLTLTVEIIKNGNIQNMAHINATEKDLDESNNKHELNTAANKIPTSIGTKNMVTTAIDTSIDGNKGQYLSVTLKDSKNNPLADCDIKITLNNVVYNLKTKSNGVAALQVNIKNSGTYKASISFKETDKYSSCSASASIKVNKQKPTLTASKKTFKTKAKTKKVTATLKTAKGKAIKGKKITFAIKGKKYSATTNSKGTATAKVKLTKKGKYTCKISFAGDTTYSAIAKSIKIVLK